AHHGAQTIELDLHRLPPAHTLSLKNSTVAVDQYWRLEDVPEVRLKNPDDYAEGFLEVYDRAVRDRLRSQHPAGVTLSGGLDSGSIAALMARALGEQGQRLPAYTSVPLFDVSKTIGGDRFGDELPFAKATADFAGNIDLYEINAQGLTPVQSMRQGLRMHGEPGHAAGNMYWIQDIMAAAKKDGVGTLLTGQGGNATISWTGRKSPRDMVRRYIKANMWRSLLHYGVCAITPASLQPLLSSLAHRSDNRWQGSAIHPDFVKRFKLQDQFDQQAGQVTNSAVWMPARTQRYAIIKPGSSFLGSLWAENGAAYGMEVRDATFDKRVMEFTLSVPDREFRGPQGEDRWLIRRAMQGLLPDQVRLNRRRGRQAGDLSQRLLDSSAEVEAALAEVEACPLAQAYLAVNRMRKVWNSVQKEVNVQNANRTVTILTRGLMAGLYLVDLEKAS
ncbi:MAG TPA: asparagine synthetase B, partial [Verrucomicrobia bacterium]|nr:asparagine synthetase B [Verrucomicrobiota bacterium]